MGSVATLLALLGSVATLLALLGSVATLLALLGSVATLLVLLGSVATLLVLLGSVQKDPSGYWAIMPVASKFIEKKGIGAFGIIPLVGAIIARLPPTPDIVPGLGPPGPYHA